SSGLLCRVRERLSSHLYWHVLKRTVRDVQVHLDLFVRNVLRLMFLAFHYSGIALQQGDDAHLFAAAVPSDVQQFIKRLPIEVCAFHPNSGDQARQRSPDSTAFGVYRSNKLFGCLVGGEISCLQNTQLPFVDERTRCDSPCKAASL